MLPCLTFASFVFLSQMVVMCNTLYTGRSKDHLWESILNFHTGFLGIELRSLDLEGVTFIKTVLLLAHDGWILILY